MTAGKLGERIRKMRGGGEEEEHESRVAVKVRNGGSRKIKNVLLEVEKHHKKSSQHSETLRSEVKEQILKKENQFQTKRNKKTIADWSKKRTIQKKENKITSERGVDLTPFMKGEVQLGLVGKVERHLLAAELVARGITPDPKDNLTKLRKALKIHEENRQKAMDNAAAYDQRFFSPVVPGSLNAYSQFSRFK